MEQTATGPLVGDTENATQNDELRRMIARLQRELRESENRFHQLVSHVEEAFYVRDANGLMTYVSPSCERIWARPAAELAGEAAAWLQTVHQEDRERVARAWARMRDGVAISEVYRICRPDGTARWVHTRAFPVKTDDGASVGTVGVVRDVTNERWLEDSLRQAQKMEAVGALASGVAHNLRNVLQAAMGFVSLAQRKGLDDPRASATLDRAVDAMKKGAALIDQLMIFSRKQEGEVRLRPVRVDQSVRDAMSLLKPLLGGQIQLEIETHAPAGVVMADPVQIEQMLLNLATNARDAMQAGGKLAFKTSETVFDDAAAKAQGTVPGPHVLICVQDSGSGMDAATQARIFEPFFTTKGVGEGTSLGLSTVFAVVRQFGGCIRVESAVGQGSKFTVCIPSLKNPLAEAGSAVH